MDRLTSLPLEAWETDFPVLDWCLRDCIRLTATGATFRRNISGADIVVGNEVVPKDAYVDRVAEIPGVPLFDSDSDPELATMPCRDGSHVSMDEAPIVTRRIARFVADTRAAAKP